MTKKDATIIKMSVWEYQLIKVGRSGGMIFGVFMCDNEGSFALMLIFGGNACVCTVQCALLCARQGR